MLFNSYGFLLLFLPVCLLCYYMAGRLAPRAALGLLGMASLAFYAWWDARYLLLLTGSIGFNYAAGRCLLRLSDRSDARVLRAWLLGGAVAANIALLALFKYADFFLTTASFLAGTDVPLLNLVLPLGISFFTFTQIAFLVDASKGQVESLSAGNYLLFVSFFPHLIAGPILHHREMMPQFEESRAARFNPGNFALGLFLLCIGLAKKMGIADNFAPLASAGFNHWQGLDTAAAWITSLAYTIQLYFDFSGYTDMALGLGWMLNVVLPQNFDSPYKSVSIQEFWRRWHMTLSRFLRDYVYLPLGGNRGGRVSTLRNLLLTFLLGGLWHGAGWTFVIWGALHGLALAVWRTWSWAGHAMPRWAALISTFLFVNFAWVYFRATTIDQANGIGMRMFGLSVSPEPDVNVARLVVLAAQVDQGLFGASTPSVSLVLAIYALVLAVIFLAPNSIALAARFRPTQWRAILSGLILAGALLAMHRSSEFLYFNF